ncbi:MAG: hypothetical protein CVU39_08660 [Chloroflexi bacterium HGW-Chloroflexi-10]|nr:MAG: hypothetical protein CVU39_08660 [Chloroflexi bacterium HGW-Chloroflexi-10]
MKKELRVFILFLFCAITIALGISISSIVEASNTAPTYTELLSEIGNPPASYYWQIQSVPTYDTTEAQQDWRSSFTLCHPPGAFNKLALANGAANQPTTVTLSWEAASGATSYKYCYDSTNDNSCNNWKSNGTSTTKTISGLSIETTYYWHVKAMNDADGTYTYANGNSTAFWSFTTEAQHYDVYLPIILKSAQ